MEDNEITFGKVITSYDERGNEKQVVMGIPDCCREGWESCPHVTKYPKEKRKNIGL